MKVTIIGAGNLGLSMAKGLAHSNKVEQLVLTKRDISSLKEWADKLDKVELSQDNKEAVQQSDVIVIAVQPAQLKVVADQIKNVLGNDQLVISTMTGQSIEALEGALGSVPIIRSMPNTAAAVEKSMTCLSANSLAQNKMIQAKEVLGVLGETLVIEESLMQAATVVCASGIAFWMRLIRATTQGAIQLGFDAPEAKQMAVQTCLGAASLLDELGNHPEAEIDRVTTPKGCTIEGLNEMEHQGLSSALIKGLVTSYQKIEEIKKSVS